MTPPPRRRLPGGRLGPPTQVRPRRIKARHKGLALLIVVIVAYSLYQSNRHRHTTTGAKDRSDLTVTSSRVQVHAGGTGKVVVRLGNAGPNDLDHSITFTIRTPSRLVMTGPGRVDSTGSKLAALYPSDDCKLRSGGHALTCLAYVSLNVGETAIWRIPVRVDRTTPAGTDLRLTVTAVGNSLYTDPNTRNNTDVAFPVLAAHAPARPTPRPTPSPTRRPTPSPTPRPTTSRPSTHPPSSATTPAPSASPQRKSAAHTARKVLAAVTIAMCVLAGLMALAVATLIVVSRRQRQDPVDYVPPRRDREH